MTFPAGSRFLAEDVVASIDRLMNPPRASLRQTVGQSIGTGGSFTALTFTTEDYDTVNGHSTSSNTSRYTCQVAGLYQLAGKHAWPANSSGQRACQWYVNGAAVAGSQTSWPAVSGTIPVQFLAVPMLVTLAVNDYVELTVFQDSGGSVTTSVANAQVQSVMQVRWVGSGT